AVCVGCRPDAGFPIVTATVVRSCETNSSYLSVFGSPVYLFVQCWGSGKKRKLTQLLGLIFQHENLCGLVSSLATAQPVSVSPHYAMIARRVERRDALSRGIC